MLGRKENNVEKVATNIVVSCLPSSAPTATSLLEPKNYFLFWSAKTIQIGCFNLAVETV